MGEEVSEYERYRLQKLQDYEEEDRLSAHFSMKDSLLGFSERPEVISNRSSPNEVCESLQKELIKARKSYV